MQGHQKDYLAWIGFERESQEWAQACSGLRQAVHTASPDSQTPLAVLPELPGLACSLPNFHKSPACGEGVPWMQEKDNGSYLRVAHNLKAPTVA